MKKAFDLNYRRHLDCWYRLSRDDRPVNQLKYYSEEEFDSLSMFLSEAISHLKYL